MADTVASLDALARKSPKAKEKLDFLRAFQVPAIWEGGPLGMVRVAQAPRADQPMFFLLAADPKLFALGPGEKGGVFARFACPAGQIPIMRVKRTGASALAKGLMLAHETSHAQDCLVDGKMDGPGMDDEWLLGELNAHGTVMTVLDQYTDGGWAKLFRASQTRRAAIAAERGKRPEASVFGLFPEDREALEKLFGTLDPTAAGLFAFQLDVDANVYNVNVQMERYKRPEEERLPHYLDVLRSLYGEHAGAIERHD